MNLNKVSEFYDATKYTKPVHVVGCGAVGSHVCEYLTRIGFQNIHLWDFDIVEEHNIANQRFNEMHIGWKKVDACEAIIKLINGSKNMQVTKHDEGLWEPFVLTGIVIMCVDSIDIRKEIVKANAFSQSVDAILDFRMRLTDAQHYMGASMSQRNNLLKTMDFTQEEAAAATPRSACGMELSVVYTVQSIVAFGMSNLVNFLRGADMKSVVVIDMATMDITTM